ncbi:hypothetical protein ACIP5Y_35590 [Nocardia sp. NPDC088792]
MIPTGNDAAVRNVSVPPWGLLLDVLLYAHVPALIATVILRLSARR